MNRNFIIKFRLWTYLLEYCANGYYSKVIINCCQLQISVYELDESASFRSTFMKSFLAKFCLLLPSSCAHPWRLICPWVYFSWHRKLENFQSPTLPQLSHPSSSLCTEPQSFTKTFIRHTYHGLLRHPRPREAIFSQRENPNNWISAPASFHQSHSHSLFTYWTLSLPDLYPLPRFSMDLPISSLSIAIKLLFVWKLSKI